LLLAVKQLKLNPSEVVYVGDSVIDSQTDDRAGTYFIDILSEVTPKGIFNEAKVSYIIDNLSNLPNLLGIN
jgi:phosphoglycolate phosphatase-like HAD superfamily hydrolase